ncbi:hypothetical protein [Saccharospirillum salsuginis]|uniref:Uncharacterized protein n=1 Tax=Saccharospirillum salsuginis TaxID=418750 RepID=A0A918KUY4_9GAMM|nr:hypothetical protein [Saccharospirillum salsuginis]GGX74524.1 hypothetical protein GCM10007392_47380 [Saccharospirillum salsuginis]
MFRFNRFPTPLRPILIGLVSAFLFPLASFAENKIEVTENFYKLTLNEETGTYDKAEIEVAKPGDLIELEIRAKNIGSDVATDVELINQVPTGAARLVEGSIQLDEQRSEIQLSPNGNTFFPTAVEIPAEDIRYVKWLIYELKVDATLDLTYRLRIARSEPAPPAEEPTSDTPAEVEESAESLVEPSSEQ